MGLFPYNLIYDSGLSSPLERKSQIEVVFEYG